MTGRQKRITYFTKLMEDVPDTEPNREAIVNAYLGYIEKIKQEEEEEW